MTRVGRGVGELRAAVGFLSDLPSFLRRRPTISDSRHRLETQLTTRTSVFTRVLERAVLDNPHSPYAKLLAWAKISRHDTTAMLAQLGVEGTLERLHDAGVFVSLEEFKGLAPVRRPGLELVVAASDFDSPLSARQYEARTGGSGGAARKVYVGLDLLDHESSYHAGFWSATSAAARPLALWLPTPPGAVGIKNALIRAKLGQRVDRWFSQNRPGDASLRHGMFSRATQLAAAALGAHIPSPEYTPATDALRVAQWLGRVRANGAPRVLVTTPSSAVRTCAAALDSALDISGSLFVMVGEPYTESKAETVRAAGCSGASHYAMVESGMIGLACLTSKVCDDVHLVSDKVATIQRDWPVGTNGSRVPALFHTTLLPASPKVMLNVESGDCGTLEQRDCGCGALPRAFRSHLHTIRSYEKLTSEGMNVLGTDLLALLEQVLPTRFGGRSTDYQLVEREEGGLTRVKLVVSPSIAGVDADEVVRVTLDYLRQRGIGQRLMAEVWANSETLQVVRDLPHVTAAAKLPPLRKVVG